MKTVTAGGTLTFVVSAVDANNVLQVGYRGTLVFSSSDSQAVLPNNSTLAAGVGTFLVTLRTIGNPTITARDSTTPAITVTSSGDILVVSAIGVSRFIVLTSATSTAGSALVVTVSARDISNNVATEYVGTVHFTSTDGNATLPGNSTLTSGVGTFTATLRIAGSQVIIGTDSVNTGLSGTSNNIDVSSAAISLLSIAMTPSSVSAGGTVSATVTALDVFNNTVDTYAGSVHFSSTDGSAILPSNSPLTSGVGTFSITLISVGFQTVSVRDSVTSSITGVSSSTGVYALGTTVSFLVTVPTSVTVNQAFSFTVSAEDVGNNVVTGYNGTVHFSSFVDVTLPANSTLTSGTGVFSATCGNVVLHRFITASDVATSSITGISGPIRVIAASSHALVFSTNQNSMYVPLFG